MHHGNTMRPSITETENPKVDFEVTEISHEEYTRFRYKESWLKNRNAEVK